MKRIILSMSLIVVFGFSSISNATLIDRGGGLIYDDVLNITWLQDANYAATELSDDRVNEIIAAVGSIDGHALTAFDFWWNGNYTGVMTSWGAKAWADQLVYQGYNDWRLPHILPVNGSSYNWLWTDSNDGSTDLGFNISAPGSAYPGSTGSEMAYMYYNNLSNLSRYYPNGAPDQPGWGLQNTGLFLNLQPDRYYSGTDYPLFQYWHPYFNFGHGYQDAYIEGIKRYAWAVRDGDVAPIPEPSTYLLLGSGLIGLAWFRRKFRKR